MATVFVIGAGPAGLFAAQKIAQAGHETIIFNRDIKPGGLAEYGIYPVKDKMKVGLRKQFDKVLSLPNVHYFGHVPVGANSPITVDALRSLCPSALVFAVGAQGTKKLGMPGEDALGVYSAKDFVYYYNQLPPFAGMDFSTGKRVAIVGMGNVMVDIARWLLLDSPSRNVEEVIVVARRGPLEAKFDDKEFAHIHMHLDREAFRQELLRVKDRMEAVGQDPARVAEETFVCLKKFPDEPLVKPRLTFRFLCSPCAITTGHDGRIEKLTLAENYLLKRDDSIACKTTGETTNIDVDTLIFAIGDSHDPSLGIPFASGYYSCNPDEATPHAKYQLFDPHTASVCDGCFLVGWARKPSEGLVGIARHDGETGAAHVLDYLNKKSAEAGLQARRSASPADISRLLEQRGVRAVTKADLPFLRAAEEQEAKRRGIPFFKFSDDEEMLAAIEEAKATGVVTVAGT
jgi:ferredoxin/flavodoxin---NADP+ reductase